MKIVFLTPLLGIFMCINAAPEQIDAINTAKQAVIFDLGGVLLREAEVNLHKAESNALKHLLGGKLPQIRIFNRAFEFAVLFCGSDCKTGWILGTVSGKEIVDKIKENIDNVEHVTFFKDEYERSLIKHGIEFILLPDLLAELTEVIHEGLEFVKKCKASGVELVIISNWDPESFDIMKTKMPELFNLFEEKNIIIPHMLGKAKPSLEIYDYTVKRIKFDQANCFFVDDSKANVEGAEQYGIKSVHHKNWQETEQELIKHGLKLKT